MYYMYTVSVALRAKGHKTRSGDKLIYLFNDIVIGKANMNTCACKYITYECIYVHVLAD